MNSGYHSPDSMREPPCRLRCRWQHARRSKRYRRGASHWSLHCSRRTPAHRRYGADQCHNGQIPAVQNQSSRRRCLSCYRHIHRESVRQNRTQTMRWHYQSRFRRKSCFLKTNFRKKNYCFPKSYCHHHRHHSGCSKTNWSFRYSKSCCSSCRRKNFHRCRFCQIQTVP